MYSTMTALENAGGQEGEGNNSEALRVIQSDMAYVFLFNIIIQAYILSYYLMLGNSKIAFF
jgi:hypothetical protein